MIKTKYLEIECSTENNLEIVKSLAQLYPIDSIWEQTLSCKIYYHDSELSTRELEDLKETLSGFVLSMKEQELEDKNWNEVWESNFTPVEVGDFCRIYASFHEETHTAKYNIKISPKMAFGTGHHETTFMMIEQMSRLDFEDKAVIDVGSGTGVLAILAAKMGAKEVIGIDHERPAYENALEHAEINHVEVEFIHGNLSQLPRDKFDIILANINRKVLIDHVDEIKELMNSNAILLMSGILRQDIHIIEEAYKDLALEVIQVKGDWTCFKYKC